jgi:outer membrane biosynthesis protein TonB
MIDLGPEAEVEAEAEAKAEPSEDAEAVPDDAAAAEPSTDEPAEEAPPQFTKSEPTPTPAPAPAPAEKKKREPKVDPLGLGLAVGGYALLVVSIGLFAGMGVRLKRGGNANDAIDATTTPDTEPQRMDAFANGTKANEGARNFGIAAGVVLVAGIALVATGHVLMKRRKPDARAQLTPTFGPRGAGLTWRIAF